MQDYVPAPVLFLQAEAPLALDLYLYFPLNGNLVLYRQKGQVLTIQETLSLSKHGPGRVLARKEHCTQAIQAIADGFRAETSPSGEVSESLRKVGEHLFGQMAREGVTCEEIRKILDDSSRLVMEIVSQFQDVKSRNLLQQFIQGLDRSGKPLDVHNRHVSSLSVLVFLLLGGASMEELSDLAIAGLVHDMCLGEIPEIFMSRHLSAEDLAMQATRTFYLDNSRQNYKAHILRALEKLQLSGIPLSQGAIKIIQQHHENINGSGLLGFRHNQIYRPARILRIVDDLVTLINRPEHPMSLEEAFRNLLRLNTSSHHGLYDHDMLRLIGSRLVGTAS